MWDLHVHTPDSLHHAYSGSDPWDRYLTELAELPADIRVLGINDYWFLTGYERVRSEFQSGNLPNLDEVFPVVEVRCDSFGGVDGKLRRINVHFICDPLLGPDVIQQQLIGSLKPRYRLSDDQPLVDWQQVPTILSLTALGQQIKESVPPERLPEYGSDLVEGFNNVCVPFDVAVNAVQQNTALKDHVLLAVGKTEWESIKWNDQSIASKKTLINTCDVVFTAAVDRAAFAAGRDKLVETKVNAKLLDCSDAHTWSDSAESNRLGNTLTWINADPTFKGLRQAVREYDHRVTVDVRPRVLVRRAQQPDTFMDEIAVRPATPGSEAHAFDFEVPFNPGFVAIIGNKGQGKSALMDTIALAANSDRREEFSFLTPGRFLRNGGRIASLYNAQLSWADGTASDSSLAGPYSEQLPSQVDYLPQSLIERVCAADPDSVERRQFEAEIERVVFRHIPEAERGDATSLRSYLQTQTLESQGRLDAARTALRSAADEVVRVQSRQAELLALGLDERRLVLSTQIEALTAQIAEQQAALEEAQAARGEQGAQLSADLAAARSGLGELVSRRADALVAAQAQRSRLDEATKLAQDLQVAVAQAQETAAALAVLIDPDEPGSIQVVLTDLVSQNWLVDQRAELLSLEAVVTGTGGLDAQIAVAAAHVTELEAAVTEQDAGAAAAMQALKDAEMRRQHLVGDPADASTLSGVQAMQEELRAAPAVTVEARRKLRQAFDRIHAELLVQLAVQDSAYGSAAQFVAATTLLQDVGLNFGVELRVRGFKASWINMVNRQRLGDLPALETPDDLDDAISVDNATSTDAVFEAISAVEDRLGRTRGAATGQRRPLSQIMRTSASAADLLVALYDLTWLQSQYVIRSEGMELRELSPGQRGLVLLMFYLLVDKSSRPLLLDQPEENLDNQTVRTYLVPALREAVKRRQVVAVTHNPNLAVVGDADQIILASHADGTFSYLSGSLAHLEVGPASVDVLEGTRAAFQNRGWKYDQVVGS